MLGHKISLNRFKKNGIISSILSDHTGNKHEINYTTKKKNGKKTKTWRLNYMLLKNKQVNEDIKEEIKQYFETSENGSTTFQSLQDAAKQF